MCRPVGPLRMIPPSSSLAPYAPGSPPVPVEAAGFRIYTDLHLDGDRPHEIAAFAIDLRQQAADPNVERCHVVVLGDLFDAYTGAESWRAPAFRELVEAFRELASRAAGVWVLRGNRDVLLEPAHVAEHGLRVADGLLARLPGRPAALLTHGDAYCLADHDYQKLRRLLRRRGMRRVLGLVGAGGRRLLARRLRAHSRDAVAAKSPQELELHEDTLAAELERVGAAVAVLGHLHEARDRRLPSGARLRVLPAWEPGSRPWDLAALLDGRS